MIRKAHIFDLDTLIKIDQKVWIVDKTKPSIPITKIELSDLHLYESGIFRSHGNEIRFNGHQYWLPNDMMNYLKVKVKNIESKMSNLGLSMQEFLNKELIENLEYKILENNFEHLKNSPDDIYVICPRRDRVKYEKFLTKLKENLAEAGLFIKSYYHINERFYNQSSDDICFNKIKLVVQHLIGLKTDNGKFTNENITQYGYVYLYDDSSKTISLGRNINSIVEKLYNSTEDTSVKEHVSESISKGLKSNIVQVTTNKLMPLMEHVVDLRIDKKLVKTFESFIKTKN